MSEYICPHCKKPIYDEEALLCLYCGEGLNRGVGFMGKIKYPRPRTITIIVLVLVLLFFIALVIKR